MKWEDVTSVQKTVAGMFALVVGISAAFGFMYATFETVVASEQKWDSHTQILVCRTVNQSTVRVAKLEAFLKWGNPSPSDKKIAQAELDAEKQTIRDLDPKHRCKQG